ncbi:hypothetical protein CYMTET_8217 [Cymbomonas tetramitiformis]|uniref:Cilia- and flagella-associated protein 54 n=1 Tax=Cymbomonas tetramitiformis TaxID=36881 RepID=A0AAE0GTX5_9CHLO|nr:hypothetical protein CYMTET_8217 [Cymbomonas tetramitiformis]
MGEVAATVNAFDSEFAKALKNLQLRKGNHEVKQDSVNTNERISTWQQLEKLGELIDHFFSKLPLHVGVPKLLEKADELHRRKEFLHAWTKGFRKVERLNLLSPETVSKEINDKDRRKYEVRARFGSAMCEATLVQEADPGMRHPHTLASLLAVLAKVQSGVQVVLPDEEHYWLVFNGTVLLYSVAAPLITAGFAAEVVEYLVFAVLALENVLLLCAPKYLDWRLQLCKAVCQCYIDLKVPEEAEKFAARALDKIKEQVHLESLDPLPLTESSEAVYKASENNLNVLLFRTQHESLANADAVLAKLEETFSAEGDRLRALIEAVREPTRRTVRHSAPAERIQLLLEVSLKVVEPHLQAFATADEARSALEKGQTIVASMPPPVEGEPVPIPEPEPAPPPPAPAKGGKENPGSKKGKKGAAEPEKLLGENAPEAGPPNIPALEAALAEAIKAMENTCQAFPMVLHIRLLTAGYTYEQPWFDDVLKAAKQRLSQAADYDGQESREVMQALVNLMLATKAVEEEASGDHLLGLAEVLYTCSDVVYRQLPDAITDAGLLVWSLVRTLLAAMLEPTGKPIEVDPVQKTLATDLLYKLHVIFTKLDLDDAMLRALLAQRLGLFLEEAGRVDDARFVLDGALQAMYAFRGHFTARARGAADENRRFISAVNLPGEQLAPGTGVGETEQAFACLQADVFQLRGRIELKIGLREQQAKAKRRKERVLKQVEKRDQQTLIFGKKTDKEHAHDHERIIQAEECLPNPVLTEAELLQTADKNHYERALVLLQMAPFHPTVAKRSQLLQEAAKELQAAQAMEARLLQMASAPPQTPTRGRPKVPPPPRVMTVNTTEVTVEPVQVALASARTATQYAVFCKPLGSGVGVSLNNTEFEGTGVFLPIEDRATIRGLRQNESYIFAVAFYDDKCAIVNGLGASTQEVVTLFPLPVLLCWAYLCLGATRLGCTSVAKQACGVIFKHFFLRKASEPLWAANPFDSLDLNKDNILAASLPLLRSVVQVLYVGGELSTTGLGLIPNLPDAAYIEVQTARLRAARRYVLGMMVSAYLADEALLNEGALRFYNGIAPLLTLRSRSSHLSKALAACHMTLHQLRSLRDEQTVAVLASITYELVHLYRNLDERQVSLLA